MLKMLKLFIIFNPKLKINLVFTSIFINYKNLQTCISQKIK